MKRVLNTAAFANLSAFLRTYLHEDFAREYGSANGAADDFRKNAAPEKAVAVAKELAAFLSVAQSVTFTQAQTWWTRDLGAAWLPSDKNQILALQRRLTRADNA